MKPAPQFGKRSRSRAEKLWLAFGGLLIALLLAGVFTLGSLRVPFEPDSRTEFVVLFALSTFNIVALLVFGLILARTLLRTWAERQTARLGARFKTKMVLGAMAVSLLPVVFLFFVSYALLNRTLAKWFPRPLEIAAEESRQVLDELRRQEYERMAKLATTAGSSQCELRWCRMYGPVALGADAAWSITPAGFLGDTATTARIVVRDEGGTRELESATSIPERIRTLPNDGEVWRMNGQLFLAAHAPYGGSGGILVVAKRLPHGFLQRYAEIEAQLAAYEQQNASLRTYRNMILLTLGLFTVLVLFSSLWFALFLSKQVTVPIEALAEGTREVARGNLGHQVDVQATAELGTLVTSFNQMTTQLADSRRQVDEFTRSLQQAVAEIEERRQLMEALQENIPTGVLSLDESGAVIRANRSVARIFGEKARAAKTLPGVMGDEAARSVEYLMRKSLRLGTATKELEIAMGDRVLHAAVTVSALGPRRDNPGYVVVIDDLTDLLRAQKAAAWQEVAQRIAHEIKNPLTPIQLSAQRLARYLERAKASADAGQTGRSVLPDDFSALAR
ncbi:MAG: sensor histidine kinase, partial [Candidatus Acidiferrales bacterium]